MGAVLFGGRVSHAIGISRSTGTSIPRLLGMVLTFTSYVIAAGGLLFYAV